MMHLSRFIRENSLLLSMCLLVAGILIWNLFPLLSNTITMGWDTLPHFYIADMMREYISQGSLSGYDPNWFGGYPLFTFYAPLTYILIVLLHFISFGLISFPLAFNLFLFCLPFYFLIACLYTSKQWLGKESLKYVMVFAWFFLTASKEMAFTGIGVSSAVYIGLMTGFFALSHMILLFGVLKKLLNSFSWKYSFFATILWGSILLTHTLTAIFTLGLLILFCLIYKKYWKTVIGVIITGFLISLWWLVPFVQNLDFTSGQAITLIPNGGTYFSYLFRGFTLENIFFWEAFSFYRILDFPLGALVFFIALVFGVKAGVKTNHYFWMIPFLLGLLLLPETAFYEVVSQPLHYYRFLPHIFVTGIFVATMGCVSIFSKCHSQKVKKMVSLSCLVLVIFMGTPTHFDLRNKETHLNYYYSAKEYPFYKDAEDLMDYLTKLNIAGRVAVQTKNYDAMYEVGSPHYLQTFLPLKYDISVVPGLLAESSLSTGFINPLLGKLFNSLQWGKIVFTNDIYFHTASQETLLQQLGNFGVEYIVVSTEDSAENLTAIDPSIVHKVATFGIFHLYQLKTFRPLVTQIAQQPFLFVNDGGMDFRTFTEQWFLADTSLEQPVIYHPKKVWEDLSQKEQAHIQGILVSSSEEKITQQTYKKWKALGKKIIFLNATPDENLKKRVDKNVLFVSKKELILNFETTVKPFLGISGNLPYTSIDTAVHQPEKLSFATNGGVFLNYSYFPKWQSLNPQQTVFWASPTMMYIIAEGETILEYK